MKEEKQEKSKSSTGRFPEKFQGNKENSEDIPFVNPIDPDSITTTPSTLPYAHTVGGAVIRPTEEGVIKSKAVASMHLQTNIQLDQIKEQMALLADQARRLQERQDISLQIYDAKMSFEPVINQVYHLYLQNDGKRVLSLIAPKQWGRSFKYEAFIASVRLLGDHTWQIVESAREPEQDATFETN